MRKATKRERTRRNVGEAIGLAERLQALISSGWGASALLAVLVVYLFRELRKVQDARLADTQADRDVLRQNNTVLQKMSEALAQLNRNTTPPAGTP